MQNRGGLHFETFSECEFCTLERTAVVLKRKQATIESMREAFHIETVHFTLGAAGFHWRGDVVS